MHVSVIAAALLASLMGGVAQADPGARQQDGAKGLAAEYDVYSALLADRRLNGRDFRGEALVVRERSVDPKRLGWWDPAPGYVPRFDIAKRVPEADASTVSDFGRQNDTRIRFEKSSFRTDLAVSILADDAFERLFESAAPPGDVWKPFYDAYPRATGIIDLSRVGFSADGTQALVYIGCQSALLAGKGFLVLLRRGPDGWKVQRAENIWVS